LVVVLKSLFSRPRPSVVPHLATEISASFPSGHSMMASVVYLTLAVLLGQLVARRRERAYFFGLGLVVVGLVGVSRVYLGVHYPTDVAAGWAAGTAWSLLCWSVAVHLQRRHTIDQPKG
jgi:undecaprenyl-diphosphatase